MKNLNLTNVIITIALFTVGWLFVPSPFHKCPKAEAIIVVDTFYLEPDKPEDLEAIAFTNDEIHGVDYQHIEIEDSLGEEYVMDILTFPKESVVTIPEDSIHIVAGDDTLGVVVLGAVDERFRSTTFYQMGDSLAQTIHEISLEPRPVDIRMRPIEVELKVEPRPVPKEPLTVLESPITWGLLGIIAGAIVTGLIVKNQKD